MVLLSLRNRTPSSAIVLHHLTKKNVASLRTVDESVVEDAYGLTAEACQRFRKISILILQTVGNTIRMMMTNSQCMS
jgi:ABC-type proline/glycine betaine transport system permease subunit